MYYAIRDRPFTDVEVEQMRLLLSTFRDGSGQYLKRLRAYMPDYLDFERVTAIVCNGTTAEDKGVFDVVVRTGVELPYGISCKMSTIQPVSSCSSFMELSNSQKKFEDEFAKRGVSWRRQPELAGPAFVELVGSWHAALSGEVDLEGSRYLVLSHNARWTEFQLLCYPLDLCIADPWRDVEWVTEGSDRNGGPSTVAGFIYDNGRRHRLWQLYQNSGGQLKYYPLLDWAEWITSPFRLELPPIRSLIQKVEEYFPGMWPRP